MSQTHPAANPVTVNRQGNGMLQAVGAHTDQGQELLPTLPPLMSGVCYAAGAESARKTNPAESETRGDDFIC
jgi:hypothetical protein